MFKTMLARHLVDRGEPIMRGPMLDWSYMAMQGGYERLLLARLAQQAAFTGGRSAAELTALDRRRE